MTDMQFKSKVKEYTVTFCDDLSCMDDLCQIENKVIIVDRNVYEAYGDRLGTIAAEELYLFDAKETHKTLDTVQELYRFMMKRSAKRNVTVISIGGGITQDVSGFLASTLYRGVKWIFLPTTFLAQTDSCIGSKTSLNVDSYKNIIGGFYPPDNIYICSEFLKTLPEEDFYSGVGEVVKFQLLREGGCNDFASVEAIVDDAKSRDNSRVLTAMRSTLGVKRSYMEEDEFDTGYRNLLNYGHCFGHALETSSTYKVPHGIAVVVGMIFSNVLSLKRDHIDKETFTHLNEKLMLPNIKSTLADEFFSQEALQTSMENDKKRVGEHLTMIIPGDNFVFKKVDDFTREEFSFCLDSLCSVLKQGELL